MYESARSVERTPARGGEGVPTAGAESATVSIARRAGLQDPVTVGGGLHDPLQPQNNRRSSCPPLPRPAQERRIPRQDSSVEGGGMTIYWEKHIHHRGMFWALCDDHVSVDQPLRRAHEAAGLFRTRCTS